MKYRKITSTRWHHAVVWAIHYVTGQMVANGETDMEIERYLQRAKLMRRKAFRECDESRHEMAKD